MSFYYLSPLILPILGHEAGTTEFMLNIGGVLKDTAIDKNDVELTIIMETFYEGAKSGEEKVYISVSGGVPDVDYLTRSFSSDILGYLVVSTYASRCYFRKLHTEHVYSYIKRPDGGNFIINASYKFGDPLIIDLMRTVGKFCLSHPAQYISAKNDIGNSTLIINPFDGPIVAKIKSGRGKFVNIKIPTRSAYMLPLVDLLEDERPGCVLYTGNNRYPAWDVRHSYSNPSRINRIDHLEFFRGTPTFKRVSLSRLLRLKVRGILLAVGCRL